MLSSHRAGTCRSRADAFCVTDHSPHRRDRRELPTLSFSVTSVVQIHRSSPDSVNKKGALKGRLAFSALGLGPSWEVPKTKGYVYEDVTWSRDGKSFEVHVRSRGCSSPTWSECRRKKAVYNYLPRARRSEFVPFWPTVNRPHFEKFLSVI